MPISHAADLSELANFIYPNSIPMPQITQKEILQTGQSLRAKKKLLDPIKYQMRFSKS